MGLSPNVITEGTHNFRTHKTDTVYYVRHWFLTLEKFVFVGYFYIRDVRVGSMWSRLALNGTKRLILMVSRHSSLYFIHRTDPDRVCQMWAQMGKIQEFFLARFTEIYWNLLFWKSPRFIPLWAQIYHPWSRRNWCQYVPSWAKLTT